MAPSPRRPLLDKQKPVQFADNADDVLVICPKPTATSSSESLYTDPLTPLGFAAGAAQQQLQHDDDDDETDVSEALPDWRASRRRGALTQKLSLLSRTHIDVFDSTETNRVMMMVDLESPLATANRMQSLEMLMQKANAEAEAAVADASAAATAPTGSAALFSVSRVKKIELPDLHVTKILTEQQSLGKICICIQYKQISQIIRILFASRPVGQQQQQSTPQSRRHNAAHSVRRPASPPAHLLIAARYRPAAARLSHQRTVGGHAGRRQQRAEKGRLLYGWRTPDASGEQQHQQHRQLLHRQHQQQCVHDDDPRQRNGAIVSIGCCCGASSSWRSSSATRGRARETQIWCAAAFRR